VEREAEAQQHHRDGGDRVGLEQVGRHSGAIADIVAHVVGDHGGVAGIVLGNPGLDLADEIGADVSGLRVDAAAEAGEDRDKRAPEGEADQVADRRVLGLVEPARQDSVVAGDPEQAEPDDEQSRHRAGTEGDVQGGLEAVAGRLGGADVRAHRDVHPDEAGRGRQPGADQEADGGSPAELVVEAEQEEGRDRDQPDRHVLAPEVGSRTFLHRLADLPHPLVAGGPAEHPDGQPDSESDRHARADERKQHGVVVEKPAQSASLTKSAPGCPGAAQFLSNERRARGGRAQHVYDSSPAAEA